VSPALALLRHYPLPKTRCSEHQEEREAAPPAPALANPGRAAMSTSARVRPVGARRVGAASTSAWVRPVGQCHVGVGRGGQAAVGAAGFSPAFNPALSVCLVPNS